ncbi:MAG: HAMP domain-containing sensor histidine kinase [Ktedonobacteraceae bacterium]
MLVVTRLADVIKQVRHLLSCGSVHILLGCPVAELRHPLLNQIALTSFAVVADNGAINGMALLQHEHIRALCDVSVYKGQLSASSAMQWCIDGVSIHSIAAAPLEVSQVPTGLAGSTGIIGLIVCTDASPDAFSCGERLLIQRYLPQIAELLVQEAADCLFSHAKNSATQTHLPSALVLPRNTAHHDRLARPVAPQLTILDPLKNEFISMLSHELRSPLTAIKGYAILLQAYGINGNSDENSDAGNAGLNSVEELTPMRQREYLDIIMEQTNHLEVLISDLLDMSRMQAGRLALHYTQVDITDLCQRVMQLVQQHADQQFPDHYTFRCTIAKDLPPLWTDARRMRQILTNLLENAVKYSPEGGLIEILAHVPETSDASSIPDIAFSGSSTNEQTATSSARQQDMFAITIRDNGIGIPLQQQPHLFKPFSRLEHPLTQDVPGAGLGLYITCKLVKAMGGNITLQSSEGKGTSITCLLPVREPDTIAFTSAGTC